MAADGESVGPLLDRRPWPGRIQSPGPSGTGCGVGRVALYGRRGQREGRSFYVAGEEVGLWSEPELTRSLARPGGWDLDSLDTFARDTMIGDLTNPFLIEDPLKGNE